MQISRFPRIRLAHLPSPLEPLRRLSEALGGPRLYIKRDDTTGLATGGSKTRKLEFLLGAALERGADTILTAGGIQSNHLRQTAAAAAKLGLACELTMVRNVPREEDSYDTTGNIQLDRLFGARIHLHPGDADRNAIMAARAAELKTDGARPYVIPTGGSNLTGALGYANAALELIGQANEQGLNMDYLVHATSSGGTGAGLLAGLAGLNHPTQLLAVDVDANSDALVDSIRPLAAEVAEALGLSGNLLGGSGELISGYSGAAYGLPTPEMSEAVEMTARLEGILLDPVYSGKAMAGLIGMIRQGRFRSSDNVIFLHTGGTPALFAYRSAFTQT